MTRETKLGLVIGGAFILGFALILSSTEHEAAIERQIAAFESASLPEAELIDANDQEHLFQQLTAYARPQVEPPQPSGTRSVQPGAGPAQAAQTGSRASESEQVLPDQEVTPLPRLAPDAALRQSPPTTDPSPPPSVADAIANRPLPTPRQNGSEVSDTALESQGHDSQLSPETVPIRSAPPASAQPPHKRERRPRRVQVYIVAKNDNLTKIARKFYGKTGGEQRLSECVDLIFQTNRTVLENKDSVRVGQKLRIPIEDHSQRSEGVALTVAAIFDAQQQIHSGASKLGPDSDKTRHWKWYQIKPKDRYTKIAKEQLGDATRWREIFEMNKEVFSDPNMIRPGVRIKLPG